jgi:hypothetical protein
MFLVKVRLDLKAVDSRDIAVGIANSYWLDDSKVAV